MTLIEGIIGSIIAAAIVGIIVAGYKRWFGRRIVITEPRPHEFLPKAEEKGGISAHPVRGTLKHLPGVHAIWLLVVDERSGKIWPQGFAPAEYNKAEGTWKGYIHVWGWQDHVTVVAVVAPPTSQDYFNYFQRVGTKTGFEPLLAVPVECRIRDTVHANVPQTPPKPTP